MVRATERMRDPGVRVFSQPDTKMTSDRAPELRSPHSMTGFSSPLLLLATFAGRVDREQPKVVVYLVEESGGRTHPARHLRQAAGDHRVGVSAAGSSMTAISDVECPSLFLVDRESAAAALVQEPTTPYNR